jgi:hypothetical protein
VAGADPSLSETIAALQGEIDTLKAEIKQIDAELSEDGVKIADRLAALKPKEDRLVKLEDRLVKLQEEKILLLQQQLQTQDGAPALGEKRSTEDEKASRPKYRRVGKDVSRMVADLRSFKVGELQPGSVVTLPPDMVGSVETDNALYIREEYITALTLWEKQREAVGGMLLVIGTPGIGKSLFGRFVFTLEMARGETVLRVTGEEKILFCGDMAVNINGVSDIGNKHGVKVADVIIVYDTVVGLHKFVGDRSLDFKCVLALHSPSAQISSTAKQMSGGAVKFVMNPFVLAEMLDFRQKIETSFPNIALKIGDEATVHKKFAFCGGSLRFALLSEDSMRNEIDEAKTKLTGELFYKVVNSGLLSGADGRICHRILHMWRKDDSWGRYVLRFCSEVVKDDVLSAISSRSVNDLLSLANRIDVNGSLRGQVWENRVHSIFSEGKGMLFNARNLNDGTISTMTIPSMTGSLVFDKIEDVECKVKTYYRPKSSNFETVDAFFIFHQDGYGLTAVLVQSTVSTSHSVKLAGLKSVLSCITRGLGQVDKTILVFLTPPVVFDKFSQHPQIITIKGGGAAANQDIVLQQVWCVTECGGTPIW